MIDKQCLLQIIGGLMINPHILDNVDDYNLTLADFPTRFHKYLFSAINGLKNSAANHIEVIDIANYLNSDPTASQIFKAENGIEYLQDALEFANVENFRYYYDKLKKLNLLRDLKKQGFDTSEFYNEDLTVNNEVNAKFEELTVEDICSKIRNKLAGLESAYVTSGEIEVEKASDNILDFIQNLNDNVEIGAPVQGAIYSEVISGAQLGTLTIRSGSSGLGKTRQAIGDACYLAYPMCYNESRQEWRACGSSEKVLFIVTEQTFKEARKMILAYLSDINDSRFKLGNFNADEIKRLQIAAKIMQDYEENLILVKMPNPTIASVKAKIRENCLKYDIHYVFYDYIFIGPSLLGEFRGFNLRNDELLLMFATALKDLAVELNAAVFTSTQVNASADDNTHIRNEASLAGGRATINKADNGAIMSRPTREELDILKPLTDTYGIPNVVTDIFKVRSGIWTQVRIWSQVDLGRMKKKDLFITDERLEAIENFFASGIEYEVHSWTEDEFNAIITYVADLNKQMGAI